jgi:hypothetical protein
MIEALGVGDAVWCVAPDSGERVAATITGVRSSRRRCGQLGVRGEAPLVLTADHPVYSPEHERYGDAHHWFVGEVRMLCRVSTRVDVVPAIGMRPDVGERTVYDLEVDHPLHNFVANGILVHNKKLDCTQTGDECATTTTEGDDGDAVGEDESDAGQDESASDGAGDGDGVSGDGDGDGDGGAGDCTTTSQSAVPGDPAGPYGMCGGPMDCGFASGACYQDCGGTCAARCQTAADCATVSGATVECVQDDFGIGECFIVCTQADDCPSGMACLGGSCRWP